MKNEGGPGAIDFASRGRELKERRAKEAEGAEAKPPIVAPPKPPVSDETAARVVRLEIPKAPLRIVPQPDRFETLPPLPHSAFEPKERSAAHSGLNLRMLSRLGTADLGGYGDIFSSLLETAEDKGKHGRLVTMETALRGLAVKPANVAIRRDLFRSSGMDDLIDMFWTSVETYWTRQPAMYVALLDELEERGFFNIANVPPPPPTPTAAPTGRQPRRDKKRRR